VGRHSAPDEPEDGPEDGAVRADVAEPTGTQGRHYAPEPDDTQPGKANGTQPDARPEPRRERATQADLRLLREHPALRAQCIAAALVPFVVYTVVLFALARAHIYVLWLWAPIIAAGVLVGVVLDVAHRRLPPAQPAEPQDGS
jgi:hypothetical protein